MRGEDNPIHDLLSRCNREAVEHHDAALWLAMTDPTSAQASMTTMSQMAEPFTHTTTFTQQRLNSSVVSFSPPACNNTRILPRVYRVLYGQTVTCAPRLSLKSSEYVCVCVCE